MAALQQPTGMRGSNLTLRIVSALVLVPLALVSAYVGGWPFVALWTLAAIVVLWEWTTLACGAAGRTIVVVAGVALAVAGGCAGFGWFGGAFLAVAAGAVAASILAPTSVRMWVVAGVFYAAAILLGPVVLRSDPQLGVVAIVLLFGVVWSTDIFAYFAGRAIGGPKLWAAVSPNKTWSGAVAGALAAVGAAVLVAILARTGAPIALGVLAFVLSAASQAGDLFESSVKRHFGAKDASQLIPGHGGLMDRLDGFVAAASLAALLGVLRGGFDNPAGGLITW